MRLVEVTGAGSLSENVALVFKCGSGVIDDLQDELEAATIRVVLAQCLCPSVLSVLAAAGLDDLG